MISEDKFWRTCLAAAILPVLFGAFSLFEPYGRDQGIHATIAFALQEGFDTYRDVYNIKPPMTTVTHWLALELFGHSYQAIRILDLMMVSAGMAALAAAILRLGGSSVLAIGASLGFSALFYTLGFWEHAQTDEWAGLFVLFATLCLALGWQEPVGRARCGLMFLAGTLMGVAFCYKYTIGTVGLLVFAPLLVPRGPVRFNWRDLFWLVIGGLGVLALVGMVLAATNTLAPFLEIQNYIRGYLEYSNAAMRIVVRSLRMVWDMSPGNAILLWVGGVAFIVSAARNWSLLHAVTLILLLSGVISAVAQGKGITYHYIPAYIAYGMVMGWAVEAIYSVLTSRLGTQWQKSLVLIALVLGMGLTSSTLRTNTYQTLGIIVGRVQPRDIAMTHMGAGDFSWTETQLFSEQFSEIRQADETFFLWGYETALYFLQEQPPLHRYPYAWPFVVTFYDGRYTADLMERLEAAPPDYIVLQKKDATPWVTDNPKDSREALEEHPQMHAFVMEGYQQILETARFDLWKIVR